MASEEVIKTNADIKRSTIKSAVESETKHSNSNLNEIWIGGKPFMNYITGVVMQFSTQKASSVVIKARGKFISRAVDVAEVVTKKFMENTVEIKKIKTDSVPFKNKDNKDITVSTIDILLSKK